VTDQGLELRQAASGGPGPIRVDLVHGPGGVRGRQGAGQELLARAVGARQGRRPSIVDATAGLGRDATMLARFGCTVTAIERSPIVAALLRDGLSRAMQCVETRHELDEHLAIVQADARQWLEALPANRWPDVVYLDPMYPARPGERALAKKEMQLLRRLLGEDEDTAELFVAARRVARQRVVVKRHHHAPPLAGRPSITFTGRSTRFDVYLQIDAWRFEGGDRR
jgi:16S rRNA (guanine1516-N2)-methyltransferase